MTTISFKVDDDVAESLDRLAHRAGVTRSKMLRRMAMRLIAERDAEIYAAMPMTADERAWADAVETDLEPMPW
jgi:predicted transcriptional regulator